MEQRVARVFGLQGDKWMRHANALSVWTRFSVLSIIALAIWSRAWIGWWSLIPVALALVWMMVNPLVFPVPSSTRNWASRGVFGERIWAERNTVDIPVQFRSPIPNIANALGGAGLILLTYGLVRFDVATTIAAILAVSIGKLWYIDRMALLYAAMRDHAEYAAWEY
jgi:hypothetical protein